MILKRKRYTPWSLIYWQAGNLKTSKFHPPSSSSTSHLLSINYLTIMKITWRNWCILAQDTQTHWCSMSTFLMNTSSSLESQPKISLNTFRKNLALRTRLSKEIDLLRVWTLLSPTQTSSSIVTLRVEILIWSFKLMKMSITCFWGLIPIPVDICNGFTSQSKIPKKQRSSSTYFASESRIHCIKEAFDHMYEVEQKEMTGLQQVSKSNTSKRSSKMMTESKSLQDFTISLFSILFSMKMMKFLWQPVSHTPQPTLPIDSAS